MERIWWRIRLAVLMTWYGCTVEGRWKLKATWRWTMDECWLDYYPFYSPIQALREDWSYGE